MQATLAHAKVSVHDSKIRKRHKVGFMGEQQARTHYKPRENINAQLTSQQKHTLIPKPFGIIFYEQMSHTGPIIPGVKRI